MMDFDKLLDALGSFGDSSFPDAAFLVEKGAKKNQDGKTLQKFRHLPHHNKNVKSPTENSSIDIPHLRNALARVNQVKPISENMLSFRKRALTHLQTHARSVLKKTASNASLTDEQTDFIVFCDSVGIQEE